MGLLHSTSTMACALPVSGMRCTCIERPRHALLLPSHEPPLNFPTTGAHQHAEVRVTSFDVFPFGGAPAQDVSHEEHERENVNLARRIKVRATLCFAAIGRQRFLETPPFYASVIFNFRTHNAFQLLFLHPRVFSRRGLWLVRTRRTAPLNTKW